MNNAATYSAAIFLAVVGVAGVIVGGYLGYKDIKRILGKR